MFICLFLFTLVYRFRLFKTFEYFNFDKLGMPLTEAGIRPFAKRAMRMGDRSMSDFDWNVYNKRAHREPIFERQQAWFFYNASLCAQRTICPQELKLLKLLENPETKTGYE